MHDGALRPDLPQTPAARKVGRIVTLSVVGGLFAALAPVVGPLAGAQEHVITGAVLLTFAASWALLATLSILWLALQDRLARLSTNSSHRIVPYTHDALVTDQTAAQTSIQGIRDVVRAVRLTRRLEKP